MVLHDDHNHRNTHNLNLKRCPAHPPCRRSSWSPGILIWPHKAATALSHRFRGCPSTVTCCLYWQLTTMWNCWSLLPFQRLVVWKLLKVKPKISLNNRTHGPLPERNTCFCTHLPPARLKRPKLHAAACFGRARRLRTQRSEENSGCPYACETSHMAEKGQEPRN